MIEIVRPTNADEIVDLIVANALSIEGLSGDSDTREEYLELIGPCDEPEATQAQRDANRYSREALRWALSRRIGQGIMWTCGLTAEGLWTRMRVDAPALYRPYQIGSALSRAIIAARSMGAWHDASAQTDLEPRPGRGAYVVIGCLSRPGYGGYEHALTVVGWDDDLVTSIDGGQVSPAGYAAVKRITRRWSMRDGRPWLLDPASGKGRRVLGWADAELLRYREDWPTCLVPA